MTGPHPLESGKMDLGHWEFLKRSIGLGQYSDFLARLDPRATVCDPLIGDDELMDLPSPVRLNDLIDFNSPLPKEDRVGSYWMDLNGKDWHPDYFTETVK